MEHRNETVEHFTLERELVLSEIVDHADNTLNIGITALNVTEWMLHVLFFMKIPLLLWMCISYVITEGTRFSN